MVKLAPLWLAMYIWIVKIIFPQKMASGAALVLLVFLTCIHLDMALKYLAITSVNYRWKKKLILKYNTTLF